MEYSSLCYTVGLPRWHSGKESAYRCRRHKRHGFDPWVRKNPWSRKQQPALVFLPGKFHGQRSLVDYSPWGRKELDTTEFTFTFQNQNIRIKKISGGKISLIFELRWDSNGDGELGCMVSSWRWPPGQSSI